MRYSPVRGGVLFPLPVADEGNNATVPRSKKPKEKCEAPAGLFGHRKRKIGFPKSLLFGKRRNNGTEEIFANSGNSGVEFVTTRQRGCGIRRMKGDRLRWMRWMSRQKRMGVRVLDNRYNPSVFLPKDRKTPPFTQGRRYWTVFIDYSLSSLFSKASLSKSNRALASSVKMD